MKKKVFIILPHQLFESIALLRSSDEIFLVEDPYYIQPAFHKQKLCLHIASMMYYYEYLLRHKLPVTYIQRENCTYTIVQKGMDTEIHMYDPIDIKSKKNWSAPNVIFHETPMFLTTIDQLKEYKKNTTNHKKYAQIHFYKWQRQRLQLLMEDNNKPLYDTWSFDKENRNKFPKEYKELMSQKYKNSYVKKAKESIKKYPKAFGKIDHFYYPTTHKEAKRCLDTFIKHKLESFGEVQDAISKNVIYGNHSILSSSLNIGLLTPDIVVQKVINMFKKHPQPQKIIASVEGFIRQIIGWREYMRFIYIFHKKEITSIDYIDLPNKLPSSWFTGTTEIELLNHCIQKVQKYAYLHHIERLMIMNNIGILYKIDYKYMYKWFMVCFIDSYDWVMIPNVLMNYNALDTNVKFMSRVYLASDNYIKKMSDYTNKKDFERIHTLYKSFLKQYRKILSRDYILAAQVKKLN